MPKPEISAGQNSMNMVVSEVERGTSRYANSLPTVLSICHSPKWWMDIGANIHVCVEASLFSSYQVIWTGALLMGNGYHTCILGVGTVIMKFTLGMMVQLKNMQLKGPSLVLIIE
jgi:hypothetical protein